MRRSDFGTGAGRRHAGSGDGHHRSHSGRAAAATPRPQGATPPDTGVLTRDLAAPARRISEVPNTDTTLKARLVELVTDAMVVAVERRGTRGVAEEDTR